MCTEVDQHRPRSVQQREHPDDAASGGQVQVGHAASQQWMSFAEVIRNIEPRDHACDVFARLVHVQQLHQHVAERNRPRVRCAKRSLRHGVLQDFRRNRMIARSWIRVEKAHRGGSVHDLRQLPAEVDRVLHADVQTLTSHRGVDVCSIARNQHAPAAICITA